LYLLASQLLESAVNMSETIEREEIALMAQLQQ
jgi:hypothetical protein